MSHIPEIRLMEIGLDKGLKPTDQESEHLAGCERCKRILEEESILTDLLKEVRPVEPPLGFVQDTRRRFNDALNARTRRRHGLALAAALAACLLFVLAVWGLILVKPSVPAALAVGLARMLVLFQVGITVLVRSRLLALVAASYGVVTLAACAFFFSVLLRRPKEWKLKQ